MEINYQPKRIKKTVEDSRSIAKEYGVMAKKVKQRMEELIAAQNLEDIRKLPAARCHELKQNLEGKLAVDVSGNHRIIFKPDHDPSPKKLDGGLDWSKVTKITILAICEDYH